MTTHAADIPAYPVRAARRDIVDIEFVQTIGAAGAVGALDSDDPAVTVAKNASAGTYDITFPKCPKARLHCTLESALGTVSQVYVAALSATAGTAQLVTRSGGGVATDPASGDKLHVLLKLETRS